MHDLVVAEQRKRHLDEPRADRRQNAPHRVRRDDHHDVGGWLFEELEQRVRGREREVGIADHEDALAARVRVHRQLAHEIARRRLLRIVETAAVAVADLELAFGEVEVRMRPGFELRAAAARAAPAQQRALGRDAEQRARQLARERLLADALRPREEIAVRQRRGGEVLEERARAGRPDHTEVAVDHAHPAFVMTPLPAGR